MCSGCPGALGWKLNIWKNTFSIAWWFKCKSTNDRKVDVLDVLDWVLLVVFLHPISGANGNMHCPTQGWFLAFLYQYQVKLWCLVRQKSNVCPKISFCLVQAQYLYCLWCGQKGVLLLHHPFRLICLIGYKYQPRYHPTGVWIVEAVSGKNDQSFRAAVKPWS